MTVSAIAFGKRAGTLLRFTKFRIQLPYRIIVIDYGLGCLVSTQAQAPNIRRHKRRQRLRYNLVHFADVVLKNAPTAIMLPSPRLHHWFVPPPAAEADMRPPKTRI